MAYGSVNVPGPKYNHPDSHPASMIQMSDGKNLQDIFDQAILVTDWNNAVTPGLYCSTDTAENAPDFSSPTGGGFYGIVFRYGKQVKQIVMGKFGNECKVRFCNEYDNNTWYGWNSPLPNATDTTPGLFTGDEKKKLAGLKNYTHPETHPASMIKLPDGDNLAYKFTNATLVTDWNDAVTPGFYYSTSDAANAPVFEKAGLSYDIYGIVINYGVGGKYPKQIAMPIMGTEMKVRFGSAAGFYVWNNFFVDVGKKASNGGEIFNDYTNNTAASYGHAAGYKTAAGKYQLVAGKNNKASNGPTSATDTTGDVFMIGCGSDTEKKNAIRTSTTGTTYGLQNFAGSGADYAEYFEWADGNTKGEDRRGLFVTLDGEKIRKATKDDAYILGVVSACPAIIGDTQSEIWKDMYLTDVFGAKIVDTVEIAESKDEITDEVIPAHTAHQWVLNPEYDANKEYISRENRKEWSPVGMMGKLVIVDDGTCQVNGYCRPSKDGIGTKADTGYRVMKRLDNTHVQILFR